MPKRGESCLVITIMPDGEIYKNVYDASFRVNQVGEAITVPPHGDLIDREKLYEQTANWEAQALDQTLRYRPEEDRDEWRWWSAVLKERSAFKFDVADAPTIIPAEEEET